MEFDDLVVRIRSVATVQQVARLRECFHDLENVLMAGHSSIVIEISSIFPEISKLFLILGQDTGWSWQQERQRAALRSEG